MLAHYKQEGYRCVLVIESNEWVILNRDMIWHSFQAVEQGQAADVNDVLLVQTGTTTWCLTPLRLDGRMTLRVVPCWPTAPGYPMEGTV